MGRFLRLGSEAFAGVVGVEFEDMLVDDDARIEIAHAL